MMEKTLKHDKRSNYIHIKVAFIAEFKKTKILRNIDRNFEKKI